MAKLKEIIGEELFKQLSADKQKEYKDKDYEDISGGAYIPKTEHENAQKSIKEYKKQVAERDTQLGALKDKVKDNEELTKEIDDLKAKNAKTTSDYEEKLKMIGFNSRLEKKLSDYKPKNAGLLKKALELDKLSLDGENFIGLEDQIKALKETDSYLFEEEPAGGTGNLGGGDSGLGDDGKKLSLGARLAKERTEANKATEAQSKFFE